MPAFTNDCVRWVFALLAVAAGAKPAAAQSDEWSRLITEADSIGPVTFIVERDYRYFYLVFNLTDPATYRTLRFVGAFGEASCVEWGSSDRRFGPTGCQPSPGSKC